MLCQNLRRGISILDPAPAAACGRRSAGCLSDLAASCGPVFPDDVAAGVGQRERQLPAVLEPQGEVFAKVCTSATGKFADARFACASALLSFRA